MKTLIKKLALFSYLVEILLLPVSIVSLIWYRLLKFIGINSFPLTRRLFYLIGVAPIVKHYYEPLFDPNQLSKPLNSVRKLPGINFRLSHQIRYLEKFEYQLELDKIPLTSIDSSIKKEYHYRNGSFEAGDADLYYSMIRKFKPRKIIEIGSGYSTLIALKAIKENESACELICIEPYEMDWLEEQNVEIIRNRSELISASFYTQLEANDILFIDSSHVIRPQGDVIFEILEILPLLEKGVYVHFHDIFSPNDYPLKWLTQDFRLWNEQYLLEAFLSNNKDFEIICSMNHLCILHREAVEVAFPSIAKEPNSNPGSFWIRKIE